MRALASLALVAVSLLIAAATLGFGQAPSANWFDDVWDWFVEVLPGGPVPPAPASFTPDISVNAGNGTLASAINSASAGDVIGMHGGTYTETDGRFTGIPSGTQANPITLTAYPGESVEVRGSFGGSASHWVIGEGAGGDGFAIHGQYGTPSTAPGSPANCPDGTDTCSRVNTDPPFDFVSGTNITVRGLEVTNRDPAWKTGPYTDSNSNDQPDVFERAGTCLHWGASGTPMTDITITQNVMHRCGELTPDGYYAANGPGGATNDADSLPDRDNLEHCIYAGYMDGFLIKDNVFYSCANRAINWHGGSINGTVENNILDSGNIGIYVTTGSCTNNLIRYNVITNSAPFSTQCGSGVTVTNNATCAATGGACGSAPTGTGNVAADPSYTDHATKAQTEADHGLSETNYTIGNVAALTKYQMGDGGTYAGGRAN